VQRRSNRSPAKGKLNEAIYKNVILDCFGTLRLAIAAIKKGILLTTNAPIS